MAESIKTKRDIAQAYIDLCAEKDCMKISVQDIAVRAQINRQTFYYHFPDKNELLRWIYMNGSLKYLSSGKIKMSNWEEQTLKMLKQMQLQADFYQNTVNGNRDILIGAFFTIVQQAFQHLFLQVDEEQILSSHDIQFYSRFFSYGCSGILETWIRDGFQESPLEIATQMLRLAQDVEVFSYRIYQRKEE